MLKKHLMYGMFVNARMPVREIAAVLGVSVSTVKGQVCRVRHGGKPARVARAIRRRQFVIHAAKNNVPPAFIAADLKMSPHTVSTILRKARKTDPAIPRFRPGPTPANQRY